MLARASWKCGEAVAAAAGLACAGGSVVVPLAPLKVIDCVRSAEMLAWAKANRCPWNARVCSVAARGGHLEALQWAREQGCPWNYETCDAAARGGHLAVLRWAREHHCPWDEDSSASFRR